MVQNSQGYRVNDEKLQEESVQDVDFRALAADNQFNDANHKQ